ncbi:MAG: hypothetical protein ABMA25_15455 [Ilumatobacteraceae bacterium]
MTSRRIPLTLACSAVLFVAACSDETSSPGTTTTIATTTTVAETTTTVAETTTTVAETTTTETVLTTTTLAPVEGLMLSGAGLGDALFGADDEGVIAYVTSILGAPDTDTGWIDPATIGACPGTEVRLVDWNDLALFFSDESSYATGVRHFAAFTYGPAFAATIDPFGLASEAGIGVGSTVAQLRATYPDAAINADDGFSGNTFAISGGLYGFLTGVTDADTITEIVAGNGCGE